MKRYLYNQILSDLSKKMVFITGPRQVGKTFLAKQIMEEFPKSQYLNYDNVNDHRIIKNMSWTQNTNLIVFDEIHKMRGWKNYIKGVYDSKNPNQSILVTGSARLDAFRQTGESLAGRYLHLRLNPFSVKEIMKENIDAYNSIELLNTFGGFPEPLIDSITTERQQALINSERWHNQYITDLIRDDILEFSRIQEINTMKHLVQLLRKRVGAPLSYSSIAGDLQVSVNTIKKYIQILESLYIVFIITPFHKNIARSLLKEPKLYFYDTAYVDADEGIKLENTCAVCLLKHIQYLHDVKGENKSLHYLKTKEGKDVDFVITDNNAPSQFIEVKLSDGQLSGSLKYFAERFPRVESIQLVHNLKQEEEVKGIKILKAGDWLSCLSV